MLYFVFFGLCQSQRVVALDAGSSGTRAMLIEYTDPDDIYSFHQVNDSKGETIYIPCDVALNYLDPSNVAQMTEYMVKFVKILFTDYIDTFVKESDRPNIPILVHSTGGMREVDPTTRGLINKFVYEYLKSHTKYNVEQKNVRTLAGDEESLFQWITVNQLWKLIDSDKTMPIISIGGASLEFTVELREKPTDPFVGQYVYDVYLHGKPHYTFRYSFIDYGVGVTANTMHQPLYDVGYLHTPCIYDNGDYSVKVRTENAPEGEYISFIGIANYTQCYDLASDVMHKKPLPGTCHGHPGIFRDARTSVCIPDPANFSHIHGLSTVMDAVSYIYPRVPENIAIGALVNASIEYTKKNITQVLEENDGDENAIWTLSNQAIVLSFLQKGFDSNPNINDTILHTERKIDGNSVYWQLGAVIATYSNGFSITPPVIEDNTNNNNQFVLSTVAIAGIAVACVIVLSVIIGNVIFCCKHSHKGYEEPLNSRNEDAEAVET